MGLEKECADLSGGTEVLATHPGRIQERLRAAWVDYFGRIDARNFPEGSDLASDWELAFEKVTRSGPGFVAISEMTDDAAVEVAKLMMRVEWAARRTVDDRRRGRHRASIERLLESTDDDPT
jgi:hypothetical protein